MKNVFNKSGFLAVGTVIAMVSVSGIAQDDAELERKLRELNIMDNIFEASLEESNRSSGRYRQARQPDSMYLAGQGMVFSFRMLNNRPVRLAGQNFGGDWMEKIREDIEQARETIERMRVTFPDLDIDFDDWEDGFEFSGEFNGVMPTAPVAPSMPRLFLTGDRGPQREVMQEMEEAMRETQEHVRDQQREIRNLQRELRGEDAERDAVLASIDSIETEMDAEMETLEEQQQAYESFVLEMETAQIEQQLAMADEVSNQIISTLCDYGSTLRSLENDEHVTIILEDVKDDTNQIYVFDFSDINDCRDAEQLKNNAVSYQLSKR